MSAVSTVTMEVTSVRAISVVITTDPAILRVSSDKPEAEMTLGRIVVKRSGLELTAGAVKFSLSSSGEKWNWLSRIDAESVQRLTGSPS